MNGGSSEDGRATGREEKMAPSVGLYVRWEEGQVQNRAEYSYSKCMHVIPHLHNTLYCYSAQL